MTFEFVNCIYFFFVYNHINMKKIFEQYGITITDKQSDEFSVLLKSFKDWNSKINLSAIKDDDGIIKKHFIDSCLINKYIDFENKSILDIGTWWGFPLLPLSITTNAKITGLDSVNKKLIAIENIAQGLKKNIKILHGRCEDVGQNLEFREKYDFVTARAVAPWPVLLELTLPFVKVWGKFIAYQGPAILEDLKKYNNLEQRFWGKVHKIIEETIDDNKRVFVIIEKLDKCSKKYPRLVGEPKRNPLY